MSWLSGWLAALGGACARRSRPPEGERNFWEDVPAAKGADGAGEGAGEEEEEEAAPLAYEQAVHLKDEGNEKFARGGNASEAMSCWLAALDALCEPPRQPEGEELGELPPPPSSDDPKIRELRVALLLNLAQGHKKLKQWRQAVSFCEEALLEQPRSVKALYRKADALGELCEWREAEEAAARLEETGEEGRKLAAQKREEWRRRRKAADGRQKKMWSAALAEKSAAPAAGEGGRERRAANDAQSAWAVPKVEQMSVFDLRRKGLEWVESEDFDDGVWKDGLGFKEAAFYQRRALPLTFLAAASLAEVCLDGEIVVHLLLDGNVAPFAEPHDWSLVLHRCPAIRSLTVVYVDIGAVGEDPAGAPPSMPYGTLLRPTEEGRVGDRVARAARFLGTYSEFKDHCLDLPGLVKPHIALWADVPLYGFGEGDFQTRLAAYQLLEAAGVPSVITQGGEIPVRGGPPMVLRVDEQASLSMAILGVGLGAAMIGGWVWNRFVVPLDRGNHGVLAGHALLGIVTPAAKRTSPLKPACVTEALLRCGVTPVPCQLREHPPHDHALDMLRKQQWEAFMTKLQQEGRPVGPEASEEERQRQSMEFYQFCGMAEPPPPA